MTSTKPESGFTRWLEHFEKGPPPFPTVREYLEAVNLRHEIAQKNLPPQIMELRNLWRGLIGIKPEQLAIVFGEQSVGLNEPAVVLAKRLVAAAILKHNPKVQIVYFSAQSDVVGSEPGLRRGVLPNPHQPNGIETVNILSGKQYQDSPTSKVPTTELNLNNLLNTLYKIYGTKNPNLEMLKDWFKKVKEFTSVAEFQDYLLENFVVQLIGIKPPKVIDYQIETEVFINGGYELIMELWPRLLQLLNEAQQKHNIRNLRVPNENEAPFYIIFHYDPSSIEEDSSEKPKIVPRGKVLMQEIGGKRIFHWCENPHTKSTTVSMTEEEIFDKIKRGKISISSGVGQRGGVTLPIIFDGHITGAGALYNKEIAIIFPEIFNTTPHYPITYMTPTNEFGQGIFQYNSYPLRRMGAPYISEASDAVRTNAVSLYDLLLSIDPEAARQLIEKEIESGNFSFNSRFNLIKSSIIQNTKS